MKKIGVVGAGTMGTQIALVFAEEAGKGLSCGQKSQAGNNHYTRGEQNNAGRGDGRFCSS